MRLDRVQVTNFRCIDDSTEFKISDITCLVGKNESGKTTVLQAIERLNPQDRGHAEYDHTRDYPRRHLIDYEERHKDQAARVVRSVWSLMDWEIARLEAAFGPNSLTSRTVEIEKRYEPRTFGKIPLDESKVLKHLARQAGCSAEEVAALGNLETAKALHDQIAKLGDDLSHSLKTLKEMLVSFPDQSLQEAAWSLIEIPKIMYFSNYDRMSGDVSIEKLREDIKNNTISDGDRVFLNFLRFAGTKLDALANINQYEQLIALVEAASIKITDQIFEYWSQNQHLKVRFTIEAARPGDPKPFDTGTIMRARIYNGLHDMTLPFSDRSAGFIWFFSFLVSFSQVKKDHGNVIVLFDEPGLNLHGRAQADLLRYFEERLKSDHQVIFTTHSPFMVPANRLDWVRTVEDVVAQKGRTLISLGTKVGGDVLSTDRDTLFPLQAALGYEITQSLVIGEHVLLVEGPADLLYLKAASNELLSRGRTSLDKRWVVCPSNGVDKIAAFLSLFGSNKLHAAVLLDYAKGQKAKVDQIKERKLLQDGHVFAVTDFLPQDEGDVEDLLGSGLYVDLVNATYGTQFLAAHILSLIPETPRLVPKIEAAFKLLPAGTPEFDHYKPAEWLIEHPQELRIPCPSVAVAIDRFEELFKRLNALLPDNKQLLPLLR
jgi:energy-coupling factor transporter ATP-binding protein EcfA2